MTPVLGCDDWPTNAALIARAVRPLGYLPDDATVMDVTYGRGRWWREYRPPGLIAHDLKTDGVDFRDLPEPTGSIDVVAYDPPYVTPGGRRTSTVPQFQSDYGIDALPSTLAETDRLIVAGLAEIRRVLVPGKGVCLAKGMNYVNGGRYRTVAYRMLAAAEALGFELIDEFVHRSGLGPQPARDVQHHARRNYSLLFVLRRDAQPWEDPAAQLFAHDAPVCIEERDCPGRPPCALCRAPT